MRLHRLSRSISDEVEALVDGKHRQPGLLRSRSDEKIWDRRRAVLTTVSKQHLHPHARSFIDGVSRSIDIRESGGTSKIIRPLSPVRAEKPISSRMIVETRTRPRSMRAFHPLA